MSQIKRLQTIDADTLQSTAYEPLQFIVGDLLPQGLHLLAGAPKIGKSWLALYLCLRVAQGEPLWTFSMRALPQERVHFSAPQFCIGTDPILTSYLKDEVPNMNERNTLSMPNIQPAAQDTPLIMPVAKETNAISFEGGNVSLTSYALPQKTPAHLTAALRAAPHLAACANYADTAPEKPLRLIFCAEHLPTAIQAAACLSACHGADEEKSGQKDDVWDDLDA